MAKNNRAVPLLVTGGILLTVGMALLALLLVGVFRAKTAELPKDAECWTAVSVKVWGVDVPLEEEFPGGMRLKLEPNGRVHILQEDVYILGNWQTEGETLLLTAGDVQIRGTKTDTELILMSFMDTGADVTFTRDNPGT